MTKVEQYLTMIAREIRAMCRDSLGSMSRTRFADRVIADVCGIDNFASSVLASRNPDAVILNAIRGSRGDSLLRLFSEQMHDARLELVTVLFDAVRVGGTDRDAHEYLQKLYQKAVKKTRKLVGSKTNRKVEFNSKYPALSRLTGSLDTGSYDFFSDDEEEEGDDGPDAYNTYVNEYFDALRTGRDLPKPTTYPSPELDMKLDVDPDILATIDRIQRRIGRRLSSAEIADILRKLNDDEEDDLGVEPSSKIVGLDPKMQEMVDAVANVVVAKLVTQGATAAQPAPIDAKPIEDDEIHMKDDLDEFIENIDKPQSVKAENPSVTNDKNITKPAPIPAPIFAEPKEISTEKLISVVNGVQKDEEEVGEYDSSETEPPACEAGGDIEAEANAKPLAAPPSNDGPDDDFVDERLIDRNVKNIIENIESKLKAAMETFISGNAGHLTSLRMTLFPSSRPDFLLEMWVSVLIDEDPEGFNVLHMNAIASRYLEMVAHELHISPNVIDLRIGLFCADDMLFETSFVSFQKIYSESPFFQNSQLMISDIEDLDSTLCAIALDIWKSTGASPFVSRVLNIPKKLLVIILGLKHDQTACSAEAVEKAKKMIHEYQDNSTTEWVTWNGLDYGVNVIVNMDEPLEATQELINRQLVSMFGDSPSCPQAMLIKRVFNEIEKDFRNYGVMNDVILDVRHDFADVPIGVVMDLTYQIQYPQNGLTVDEEREYEELIKRSYISEQAMADLIRVMSPSFIVKTYFDIEDYDPYEGDAEDVPEADEEPKTNAFGVKPESAK